MALMMHVRRVVRSMVRLAHSGGVVGVPLRTPPPNAMRRALACYMARARPSGNSSEALQRQIW